MIGTTVSIILLLTGIMMQKRRGTWSSPDVLFCYQWALISFMASLHLFKMYEASDYTWFVILIGSLSFVLGTSMAIPRLIKSIGTADYQSFFFNKATFWILFVILFVFSWQDFWVGYKFQQLGYTLSELRHVSFGGDDVAGLRRGGGALYEIFQTLKSAATLLEIAVGIHYYIVGSKKRYWYIIAVATLVLLQAYTDGGRFGLAYMIVEIFVCYHFFKSNSNSNIVLKRSSVGLYLVIIFLGFAILSVSFARDWEAEELGIKYYRYLCGNIPFFDQHMNDFTEDTPIYLIWNSFHGLWALVFPVLSGLFGIPNPDIYRQSVNDIISPLSEMIPIGVDMQTNAFVTPFYHLYADGRIVGVVLGMILFGYLAGKVYAKAKYDSCGRNVIFYLIISQMIFKTLQMFPFFSSGYVFIILFFLFYRRQSLNILG